MENLCNIWKVKDIVVNNMKNEYDIDDLVSNIDFKSNQFQEIKKGIFLTNKEIEVLEKYHIPYQNCHNLKEIIFSIEEVLEDMDIVEDELELVSSSISERDYYQNTNK